MSERQRDVFVLGFSDHVRALLDHLAAEAPGFLDRVVVIDHRNDALTLAKAAGVRGVHGDPLDLDTLRQAGFQDATMVVCLVADHSRRRDAALDAVQLAKLACPEARVLVSARDEIHAAQLRAAGASEVFVTPRFP
jgi:Trk K+ transport system NAD-binding subunit